MLEFTLNEGIPESERPEGLQLKASAMPAEYFDPQLMAQKFNIGLADAQLMVEENRREQVFRSRDWQVHIKWVDGKNGWPSMFHLNCRRTDREALHDWRELQAIKNILIGPEHEAVELYPAESRLTDTANNYHLWVLANPTARFPFGFASRAVFSEEDAEKFGAKQRTQPKNPSGGPD